MSDQPKDFTYYADKAEQAAADSELSQLGSLYTAWKMHVAELYVKLAVAAPEPAARRIELHDAACPCIKK